MYNRNVNDSIYRLNSGPKIYKNNILHYINVWKQCYRNLFHYYLKGIINTMHLAIEYYYKIDNNLCIFPSTD